MADASERVFGEPGDLRRAGKRFDALGGDFEELTNGLNGPLPAMGPTRVHAEVLSILSGARDVGGQLAHQARKTARELQWTALLFEKAGRSADLGQMVHNLDGAGELDDYIRFSCVMQEQSRSVPIPDSDEAFLAWVEQHAMAMQVPMAMLGGYITLPPGWEAIKLRGVAKRYKNKWVDINDPKFTRYLELWSGHEKGRRVDLSTVRARWQMRNRRTAFGNKTYQFRPVTQRWALFGVKPGGKLGHGIRGLGRVFMPAGAALDAISGTMSQAEIDYFDPTVTNQEYYLRAGATGAATAGGGVAGAAGGAAIGFMIGGPIGAGIGGIVGGIGGSIGGQEAADQVIND